MFDYDALNDHHFKGDQIEKRGWTPLHLAVWAQSLDVLQLLLELFCDPAIPSADGKTPVHLCGKDSYAEVLKVLLRHGGTAQTRTRDAETLWHIAAKEGSSKILEVLIDAGDIDGMLEELSHDDETPICAALGRLRLNAVLALLPHCNSPTMWRSKTSIFRNAARLGSSAVVEKLMEVGVEIDGLDKTTGSPLHFLGPQASAECINLLKAAFDISQRKAGDGETPFGAFVLSLLERGQSSVLPGVWEALLPPSPSLSPEEASKIWHFLTHLALPKAFFADTGFIDEEIVLDEQSYGAARVRDVPDSTSYHHRWLPELVSHYLQLGVVRLHETKAAFSPICQRLTRMTNRLQESKTLMIGGLQAEENLDGKAPEDENQETMGYYANRADYLIEEASPSHRSPNLPPQRIINWAPLKFLRRLKHWSGISDILHALLQASALSEEDLADPGTLGLLLECIIHDDERLLKLLLGAGVDVHSTVLGISAFELACLDRVRISDGNFDLLLDSANPERMAVGNPQFDDMGPLHFAFPQPWVPGNVRSRLGRLLKLGISCDLPNSRLRGTPLLHHTRIESIETARMMLESGADPWSTCITTNESTITEALTNSYLVTFLGEVLATKQDETDSSPTLAQARMAHLHGRHVNGFSALHLVAASGNAAGLDLLLENGYFQNVDVADDFGHTPIHAAVDRMQPRMIEILCRKGANIDAQSKEGLTALHLAARNGDLQCVDALLRLGAKQIACFRGWTPLREASKHPRVVQLLETKSGSGMPHEPMTHARDPDHLARELSEAIFFNDLEQCRRTITSGCPIDIELYHTERVAPLMAAVVEGASDDFVTFLISSGASVSIIYRPPYLGKYYTVLDATIARPGSIHIMRLLLQTFLRKSSLLELPLNLLCRALNEGNIEAFDLLMTSLKIEESSPRDFEYVPRSPSSTANIR